MNARQKYFKVTLKTMITEQIELTTYNYSDYING